MAVATRRGPPVLQVRRYANIEGATSKKSKSAEADDGSVVVGLDPLSECVLDLRRRFGEVALFFFDAAKGDAVHVVLKPSFFLPTTFRALDSSLRIMVPPTMGGGGGGRNSAPPS